MTNYYSLTPYKNRAIEDMDSFARKWQNFLKRMCKNNNWTLINFNTGHYYCSWFIKNENNKFIYCSFSDVRYFSKSWYNSILYRDAKNESDYTGGSNFYTKLENLENAIRKRFQFYK